MSKNLCGDCKYFEVDTVSAVCEKKRWICDDDAPACNRFEKKITNGDKIRQMSDEELAEKFVVEYRHGVKDYAYYSTVTCGLYNTKAEAITATVARLKEVAE